MAAALLLSPGCAPTIDEDARLAGIGTARAAPEPSPIPRFTGTGFVAADGQVLPLRKWLPNGAVKAVILALHGFNDYSNAFEAPGEAWAKRGIATYAYDQRGFGAAPERGVWPGRAALAADAATASQILRRLYPRVPLYLLGDSMGGAVAVVAMTRETGTPVPDVDGVILTAPAVWGRATMDLLPRLALWAGVRLMPRLTVTGRGLEIKPSDNIVMLRALSRDPLVIKETRVDTIYGLVDLMDAALDSAPLLDARLLVMYGAKDEIVPKTPIRRFVGSLPPECRHHAKLAWYKDRCPRALIARPRKPSRRAPANSR
jgi:alpha-beta hydrolase superfamily lysophospholipase